VNTVEVALSRVRAPRWRAAVAGLCRRALVAAGIDGWDLSVLLTSDDVIRGLNARYRGMNRATDVLSFPQHEGVRIAGHGRRRPAGDLVISLETLRRNAAAFGVDEREELARLAVHGILHLAGMEHGPGKGRAMRDREREVLKALDGRGAAGVRGGGP
jgi:probable rRNA maturation factor